MKQSDRFFKEQVSTNTSTVLRDNEVVTDASSRLEKNEKLCFLKEYIGSNIGASGKALKDYQFRDEQQTGFRSKKKFADYSDYDKNHAANTIQKFWRERKIKVDMENDPYFFYLSLIGEEEEHGLLSSIMFGRHVAEIKSLSTNRINNPFIWKNEKNYSFYHRYDCHYGEPFNNLLKQYGITKDEEEKYSFIPVCNLNSINFLEFLRDYYPEIDDFDNALVVFKKMNSNIELVRINKNYLNIVRKIHFLLINSGFIASAWEIAINTQTPDMDIYQRGEGQIKLNPNLPHTMDDLLKNKIFFKLKFIASSKRHATHNLALSLEKMLQEELELSSAAIQRIALMIDIANTFYEHNYPRYAFYVYIVIHEISLSLITQTNMELIQQNYTKFLVESETTLLHSLGLKKESLENSNFVATPAISGTSAYCLAMQLARKMKTDSNRKPTVVVWGKNYFELNNLDLVQTVHYFPRCGLLDMNVSSYITSEITFHNIEPFLKDSNLFLFIGDNFYYADINKKTVEKVDVPLEQRPDVEKLRTHHYKLADNDELKLIDSLVNSLRPFNPEDADIFIMSAGPIAVSGSEIESGIDINSFIKSYIIKRRKRTTIVVDATTALYKNLLLDPESRALIENGQLSIIVHESHQKFGLIHTDQAQYGRMFGILAKSSYENLDEFKLKSEKDYKTFVDMRIGAFISISCSELLEEIKQQHFINGAILRNIFIQIGLIKPVDLNKKDMLQNLDELYFITGLDDSEYMKLRMNMRWLEARESFGHYCTTLSRHEKWFRVCADASDNVDSLILAARVYLNRYFSLKSLFDLLFESARNSEKISLEHQIILLAMLDQISAYQTIAEEQSQGQLLEIYTAMRIVLNQCSLLKDRQYYLRPEKYILELQIIFDLYKKLIKIHGQEDPNFIFKTVRRIYCRSQNINDNMATIGCIDYVFDEVNELLTSLCSDVVDIDIYVLFGGVMHDCASETVPERPIKTNLDKYGMFSSTKLPLPPSEGTIRYNSSSLPLGFCKATDSL